MATVDVIIPCYNYARYLAQCAGSILAQEGVDLRVLIIDDCSSDDTAEVGAALARQDRRVEFRRHAVNRKNIATFNEGFDWMMAEYCVLISADDMLTPGSLRRATDLMGRDLDVGFVYGRIHQHRDGEPLPRVPADLDFPTRVTDGAEWIRGLVQNRGDGIVSPEVVVRTRLQKEVGGYDKSLPHSADISNWIRLAARGRVGFVDGPQAVYRVHDGNMHHSRDGRLMNVFEDRLRAFLAALDCCAPGYPHAAELRELAGRSLAREALWAACEAFDRNEPEAAPAEACLAFARRSDPNATTLREYAGLKWRLRCGRPLFSLLKRVLRRGAA
jgi:glycosyltransferase involved in cell wall biosynthesis